MNIRIFSILTIIGLTGGRLNAAPLELDNVSAQANWMIHEIGRAHV